MRYMLHKRRKTYEKCELPDALSQLCDVNNDAQGCQPFPSSSCRLLFLLLLTCLAYQLVFPISWFSLLLIHRLCFSMALRYSSFLAIMYHVTLAPHLFTNLHPFVYILDSEYVKYTIKIWCTPLFNQLGLFNYEFNYLHIHPRKPPQLLTDNLR